MNYEPGVNNFLKLNFELYYIFNYMAKASVYSVWEVLYCEYCVLDTNEKVHFVYQMYESGAESGVYDRDEVEGIKTFEGYAMQIPLGRVVWGGGALFHHKAHKYLTQLKYEQKETETCHASVSNLTATKRLNVLRLLYGNEWFTSAQMDTSGPLITFLKQLITV